MTTLLALSPALDVFSTLRKHVPDMTPMEFYLLLAVQRSPGLPLKNYARELSAYHSHISKLVHSRGNMYMMTPGFARNRLLKLSVAGEIFLLHVHGLLPQSQVPTASITPLQSTQIPRP